MRMLWIGVLVTGLVLLAQSSSVAQKKQIGSKIQKPVATEVAPDVYACPMHPDVVAAKAGKCSKCGMALEKTMQKSPRVQSTAPAKKTGMKHDCKDESKEKCGGCEEPCGDR